MKTFKEYAAIGLSVIPLRGKLPLISWRKYQDSHADDATIAAWDNTKHNIGVITGHISGILVVDVDGDYPSEWPEMPETWTVKTKKGYHYYFNLPDDANYRNSARLVENVDIRSNGGYVVAPPSEHPDGGSYEWVKDKSPAEATLADIPDFVVAALDKHDKRLYEPETEPEGDAVKGAVEPEAVKPVAVGKGSDRDNAYIEAAIEAETSALRNTGKGGRNDQLNKSAFALSGLIGAAKTIAILTPVALSIGLSKVETEKTIKSACDSSTPRSVPSGSSLPPPESPASLDGEMPLIVKNILQRHGKEVNHAEIAPDLISGAPGFIGNVIRWILETSLYPQPVLALASAIPAVGNVMAHRVSTETDLRTNFFTLGIAESGAGKDHARKCIAKLYKESGLGDSLLGDPASATAVINSIKRAKGRGLMRIDEFGRFMESLKGGNAASHVKMITTNMMHMYNHAGEFFTGQEYADNEVNGGRSDIDQPCLNIYATTVANRFYKSMSSEEAYDGFLSRWLIFETTRFDIDPCVGNKLGEPPSDLVDHVKCWNERPTYNGAGSLGGYTMIKPRIVDFTDESRRAYHAFIRDCRLKMSQSDNLIEKAFWNRTAEHTAKLALVAHDGDYIDSNAFDWAVSLAKALTVATVENIKANVSDNAYEAELQNILKMIVNAGSVSKSDITRKTRTIDRRKRQDILDTLVESGDVIEEKNDNPDGGRPLTIYKAR